MYNISNDVLELFKKNYRQVVNITFRGKERTFVLTEADIKQGGLTIDRYCVSGSKIEIGSAIAAELKLTLDNHNDRFSDEVFEDAELEVKIGIKKWDAYKWENAQIHWIPCGFFTVDDPPRKLTSITLSALDRMVKFDVPISNKNIITTSVRNLVQICCDHCGVILATNLTTLPNANYTITYIPEDDEIEDITYRQLIQWCSEIMGVCAYIDWEGKLRLEWYKTTSTTITPKERYKSDLYENDITITGVQLTDNDDNVYLKGTDDYAFHIQGNKLITHDYETIVESLNSVLNGFSYRPYSCSIKPMPHIYPLDVITYVDKYNNSHKSIITNTTFKINMSTNIVGKGETSKKSSYAQVNPLNKAESIAIQKIQKKMVDSEVRITQSFQAADGLLLSSIEAEITRASGAEESLSSRITQTAESITAEVTRATEQEELLQAAININASSIEAEVTRAISAEESLSSRITQTAESIEAKVSATGGTDSSFSWSLTVDGFVLKASNNTVMSVTSSGLSVVGNIDAISGSIGGFNITSFNLWSSNILMGNVINSDDNTSHSLLAVGIMRGSSFAATAQLYDNTVMAYYGIFNTINTDYLNINSNITAEYIRGKRFLASSDISSTTGFYFGYSAGSVYYYAKITTSGTNIYIKIYDSNNNLMTLTESKSFTVYYACIWGKDKNTTMTIEAGSNTVSYDTNAFWGIDYATFDSSLSNKSSRTKSFLISGANAADVITSRGHLVPYNTNTDDLGSEAYRYSNIYLQTSPNVSSDRNEKNTIDEMVNNGKYEKLFDSLIPVSFKYNQNTSNRTHLGLIAQDLKKAILDAGLTTQEVAAYCEYIDLDGNVMCGIRYEELIALCINEIQKLKTKIAILENKEVK